MNTIPQRLREIARSIDEMECGSPVDLSCSLRFIAAELEAPAADAGRAGPWCCANGKASGVQVCATCAEATAGYSAAMSPKPEPAADAAPWSDEFIHATNDAYIAWCATHYQPEALDERGMMSLHGLWAWQEQERRTRATVAALQARINALEAAIQAANSVTPWHQRVRGLDRPTDFAERWAATKEVAELRRCLAPSLPQPDTTKEQP